MLRRSQRQRRRQPVSAAATLLVLVALTGSVVAPGLAEAADLAASRRRNLGRRRNYYRQQSLQLPRHARSSLPVHRRNRVLEDGGEGNNDQNDGNQQGNDQNQNDGNGNDAAGEDQNDNAEEQQGDNANNENNDNAQNNDEGNNADNNNDDGKQDGGANDDKNDNDDGKNNRPDGADDWFDDRLADDYVYDDDAKSDNNNFDDFYAYQDDPRPPRLLPFSNRYMIGYVLISMALTLGASGGVGGGGIVVPVYLLVMGLSAKIAIPVSAATVLGGVTASTMVNWRRRHPLADRPIIDWDLVLLMEPLTLVGALFGSLFHRMLSEKVLIVLLVLLLSVSAHSTLKKGMRMYQAEKRYIRHLKAAQDEPPSGSPLRGSLTFGFINEYDDESSRRVLNDEEKRRILILNPDFVTLKSHMEEEEKFTPRSKIAAIFTMFSILIFLNVMAGGAGYVSPWNIHCGSVAFWVVHVIMVAFLVASAWVAQTYLIMRHEIKDMVRFDYVHGDIKWDARSALIYPAVFVSAGLSAGLLGMGGGVIIVPLLLTAGIHPGVATATSSAMIIFTSFASTSTYMIFGLLLRDFAVFGFGVGFVSSLTGQMIMKKLRQARSASGRKFERNSYVTFVIGGVVLVSALLMTIQYVFRIVEEPSEEYNGLCDTLRF